MVNCMDKKMPMDIDAAKAGLDQAYTSLQERAFFLEKKMECMRQQCIQAEKVFVYGAGDLGIRVAVDLLQYVPSQKICFIDRDTAKQNTLIYENLSCYPIHHMYAWGAKAVVLVATKQAEQVARDFLQPEWRTVDKLSDIIFISDYWQIMEFLAMDKAILADFGAYRDALRKIQDDESLKCLLYHLSVYSKTGFRHFDDNDYIEPKRQYFPPWVIQKLTDGSAVLCNGFFCGELLHHLLEETMGKTFRIQVCEANKVYAGQISRDDRFMPNVEVSHIILGQSDMEANHAAVDAISAPYVRLCGDDHGMIQKGDTLIQKGKLLRDISLLVLDMRQNNGEALCGMADMIRRNKPDIVIPVYAPGIYIKRLLGGVLIQFARIVNVLTSLVDEYCFHIGYSVYRGMGTMMLCAYRER